MRKVIWVSGGGSGLETPIQIRNLQRKLYLKAKTEPTYRFYRLYDKIYRTSLPTLTGW